MSFFDQPPLHDFPDRAIRRLLEDPRNLRDLLTAVVPDLAPHFDFSQVETVDRSFLMEDWRRREADLVFRIPYRVGDAAVPALVCVLLEHQSEPDPRMALRLLIYAVLYWEREWRMWEESHGPGEPLRLTPILPIVFHTGTAPWTEHRTLADLVTGPEAFRAFVPQWQPLFWDLAVHPTEELLSRDEAWLQALAVVRADRADHAAQEAVFDAVIEKIQCLEGEETVRRQELLWFVLSWILRRWPREEAEQMIRALHAGRADAARRGELQKMTETISKSWEEETRERVAQAAADAEAVSLLRSRQETLRLILEERFGNLPPETLNTLQAIEDPERLVSLMRRGLRIEALSDLEL